MNADVHGEAIVAEDTQRIVVEFEGRFGIGRKVPPPLGENRGSVARGVTDDSDREEWLRGKSISGADGAAELARRQHPAAPPERVLLDGHYHLCRSHA